MTLAYMYDSIRGARIGKVTSQPPAICCFISDDGIQTPIFEEFEGGSKVSKVKQYAWLLLLLTTGGVPLLCTVFCGYCYCIYKNNN